MKNRNKPGNLAILLVLLMAIACVGCDLEGSEEQTGSLEITLVDGLNTRTIVPGLDMEAAKFLINGNREGSSDSVGPVEIAGASHTFSGIPVGNWTISVEAYNEDDVRIGEGSAYVVLTGGPKAVANVVVVPVTGTGNFTFTLDWTGNALASPVLTATLTAEDASEIVGIPPEGIVISGSTATITVGDLPSGYYDFTYTLKDDEEIFAGNFHEVRILAGQTTSGSEDLPVYPFEVSVVINMNNPFPVTISSDDFILECATSQSFTVAPADASSYQWYLDGEKIAGANEAVCEIDGEGMAFGWHNLSVKVKKAADWVSSGTVAFYVDDLVGRGGWIDLTFTSKDDATDTMHFVFTNGPDEETGFGAIADFPEDEIPIQIEMPLERAYVMTPASLMVSSSIPLAIGAEYALSPADPSHTGAWMNVVMASWNMDSETVVLGVPYEECIFDATIIDDEGDETHFASRESFHNPVINEEGDRLWPDGWWNAASPGVLITYTRYGNSIGSYVKGVVNGTVITVVPGEGDELDTQKLYTVEGYFVTSRAILKPIS